MQHQETAFSAQLLQQCQKTPQILCFPEALDPRILRAASYLLTQQAVDQIFLLSKRSEIRKKATSLGLVLPEERIICKEDLPWLEEKCLLQYNEYCANKGKAPQPAEAQMLSQDPLVWAAHLLDGGSVSAVVAGAVRTTADVIRAGIRFVGMTEGVRSVSSSFIFNKQKKNEEVTFMFADCGVIVEPSVDQLVDIAVSSAHVWQKIKKQTNARIAFLSFSTKGSASSSSCLRMAQASKLAAERLPNCLVDGELQFDAAWDPDIAMRKIPGYQVANRADIFIFPNLDAGNIAYKIVQRMANFSAFGPILQGLKKPFTDLSRGSTLTDILVSCYIALLQSDRNPDPKF